MNDLLPVLRSVLSDAHFETIERITNKSKDKEYVKKRNLVIEKDQSLTKGNKILTIKGQKFLFKLAVLVLTNQEFPRNHLELLNLEPKFIPSSKKLLFMDIVNATEFGALSLEKGKQNENGELLRQKISNIIFKNINSKIRCNLTLEQRTVFKELLQSTEDKVYCYDNGNGLVILNNKDAIQKIEKQN